MAHGGGVAGWRLEGVAFVIAHGEQCNPGAGEFFGMCLQLDQLRATRRSPHGGSMEHHHGRTAGACFLDVDEFAGV